MKPAPFTKAAYRLLHEGALALAQVEANGIRIDVPYLNKAIEETNTEVRERRENLMGSAVWRRWKKRFRHKANLNAREQLGVVLFDVMGFECPNRTEKDGRYATDEETLQAVDHPFVQDYLTIQKLQKAVKTNLEGIRSELVGELLHPVFSLNLVVSYRSCVAKGTMVEVVRDLSKNPKGVPIEEVKPGDLAYCYDSNRKLVLRRVLWAGKTGRRKVVRVHWNARGKHGTLDLTPEHRVRLASGAYVRADELLLKEDRRTLVDSRRAPKVSTLALGRLRDRIFPTRSETLLDHRFVWEQTRGEQIGPGFVVHHRDENHLNNEPSNLRKVKRRTHGQIHGKDAPFKDPKIRAKAHETLRRNLAQFGYQGPKGEEHWNYLHLTRFALLRLLAKVRGRIARTSHDFETIKQKAEEFGFNLRAIKRRYDGRAGGGEYISLGRLRRASTKSVTEAKKELRINHYKFYELLEEREFVPNNHRITAVEEVEGVVDVYDVEVEGEHNFIANEICVHNSSQEPNFQNWPVRDKRLMRLVRSCFIARPRRRLVELDYRGVEVCMAACYHKDPSMISYIEDKSKDMHRDQAAELYKLPPGEVSKEARYCAKNMFVFPEFYGSWYLACARDLWAAIDRLKLRRSCWDCAGEPRACERCDGTGERSLKDWLRKKGIKELGACVSGQDPVSGTFEAHVRDVERRFWRERFPVYAQWKRDMYARYQATGWVKTKTGFTLQGFMRRNEVNNYPVQGSAFHCLLWSLTRLQLEVLPEEFGEDALLVGQIHDSLEGDVVDGRVNDFIRSANRVMTKELVEHWPWICVPLEIEAEVTPVEGCWADKAGWRVPSDAGRNENLLTREDEATRRRFVEKEKS